MALLKVLHLFFLFLWVGTAITIALSARMKHYLNVLYRQLTLPSMLVTLLLGSLLFYFKKPSGGWLHMKLTFSCLLVAATFYIGKSLKKERISVLITPLIALLVLLILIAIYVIKK